MKSVIFVCAAILCLESVLSAPNGLVLSTLPPTPQPIQIQPIGGGNLVRPWSPNKEGSEDVDNKPLPIIYKFDVNSTIRNRFAKTIVTSKVRNAENKSQEAAFTMILPEKAFISEFVMDIDGKQYKAYVKEKEEAKHIYDTAVSQGISAGHVSVSARDSNRFTVSINIEPEKKATFYLTYEELLERKNNQYELVLNIHPGQIVDDLQIQVHINETKPLKFVRTASLRSGNEINKNDDNDKLDTGSDIEKNSTTALVAFRPSKEQQKGFAKELGVKENDGLSGQFVVQYDVERDPKGEVLLQDGYFVHFFAPDDQKPLPKHVVFVLDTSGSMYGNKIKQLRDAMTSILHDLKEEDSFHIVEFETDVYVWDVNNQSRNKVDVKNNDNPIEEIKKQSYPHGVQATKENIEKGIKVVEQLTDNSLTNILTSLEIALHLVDLNLKENKDAFKQPMVVFLTDGDPTIGVMDRDEITKIITNYNTAKNNVPIFALSFGDGADKAFLRKLSLKNQGFSRHIYEAADASLQLEEFYKQISNPLLANLHFKYDSDVTDVTRKIFPIYFKGGEIVTAGRLSDPKKEMEMCKIEAVNFNGFLTFPSVVEKPVTSLERLWAYLTIKRKLEERDLVDNKTQLTQEALDLALKYSFVTDVSSLVVVKPNETNAVATEDASHNNLGFRSGPFVPYSGQPGLSGPPGLYRPTSLPAAYPQASLMSFSGRSPLPGQQAFHHKPVFYGSFDDDMDMDNIQPLRVSTTTIYKNDLNTQLPWLSSVLAPDGNSLMVKTNLLMLKANVSLNETDPCTGTPRNASESGVCKLLDHCLQVLPLLTDFQTYEKYHCVLDTKYAGVCCPDNPVVPVSSPPLP